MLVFLRLLDERYGGVENYLMSNAGLTSDDLSVIKRNISDTSPNVAHLNA
jgi:hypothetical protein